MKNKILSLDISSSVIGFAIFEYDSNNVELLEYGHYKPPSKKQSKDCLPFRLNETTKFINKILDAYHPNEVIIEDYAKKFSKGKSTAQTIILLAVFNEICDLISYQKLNKKAFRYPVVTIRSVLSKHFNVKIVSKEDIFPLINSKFSKFKVKFNKNKKIQDFCYDEADAIALGASHILKTTGANLTWNI